jgi:hypothetical protein
MANLVIRRPAAAPFAAALAPRQIGGSLYLVGTDIALSGSVDDWLDLVAAIEPYLTSEPGVLTDLPESHTRSVITAADIAAADDATARYLVYQKFLATPVLRDVAELLPADWKRPPTSVNASAAVDPALLSPYRSELIGPDGRPVRGAQTRVAEILGFPQTGGSYRAQILAALEGLRVAA